MRRAITTFAFGFVFAVMALNATVLSQRIDGIGQQATAGPHMPVVPMTFN